MDENFSVVRQLFNQANVLLKSYERVAEATGENFNVFSVLRLETKEEQTHSRFIAELLNPKGKHGKGDVFLRLFFEMLNEKSFAILTVENSIKNRKQGENSVSSKTEQLPILEGEIKTESAKVSTEYYLGKISSDLLNGGRIDVLVDNSEHTLVIENKIYAANQKKQLERYCNAFPAGIIIYLTLDGRASPEEGTLRKMGKNYIRVSYQDDITTWLEKCLMQVSTVPILRETIVQYQNLIKKLTGQNAYKEMSKELRKLIVSNKENFEAFKSLSRAGTQMMKTTIDLKLDPMIKEIAKNFRLSSNHNDWENRNKKYKKFWFWTEKMEENNLKIQFEWSTLSGYNTFIYGVAGMVDNKNGENIELSKKRNIIKAEMEKSSLGDTFKQSKAWIGFNFFEGYENWENLDVIENVFFGDFKNQLEIKVKTIKDILDSFLAKFHEKK